MPFAEAEEVDVIDAIVEALFALPAPDEATRTMAILCLADALACALAALVVPACGRLLGPVVPGTTVPKGARVPGRAGGLDPIKAAFDTTVLIRWLGINDTSPSGGHPSDTIGTILAVADHISRQRRAFGEPPLHMDAVLQAMALAYEIHGALIETSRRDRPHGEPDATAAVRIAATAVAVRLMGGGRAQARAALSHALLEGSLPAPARRAAAGARRLWAEADAGARGIMLAWLAMRGETGVPKPAAARPRRSKARTAGPRPGLARPLGYFYLNRVTLRLLPCHASATTAVEAALRLSPWFRSVAPRVASVNVETHDTAMRRTVVGGTLLTPASRERSLPYTVATALLQGRLESSDYSDATAANPALQALRARIQVTENAAFTASHHDPGQGTAASAVQIVLNDGTCSVREKVAIPIGDARRRQEATPLVHAKLLDLGAQVWTAGRRERVLATLSDPERLQAMAVDAFMDLISG
ncbi:2-methylcitrate dehydratase [Rhodovastum atsumiense]|uniref:2-methylcitrate dehydratase n=1 Tax=Rhodovastum atsumiense TaxID=504468 RepID=A0A5M6IKI0_9PROT|nr:MmgE/PrpD family protein [Rhodovastum atsumiense]KAA5608692.1 2-methylcitrate dehydratase [Rhodovastum atsumiense]CAH2599105.1 2-methylcitrate dehydratase [Rhodovastum atsumiense]